MKCGAKRVGSIGMLTGMLLAGAAGAVVKTTMVSNSSPLGFVAMSLFDPRLGKLLSVYAEATYTSNLGYMSNVAPVGYDHAVSGSATLGGLSFAITGASQANQATGYGIFTVTAAGNATWSDPTQLSLFASNSGTMNGTASVDAPAPGSPMPLPYKPTVQYALTYTYDDGTPAVPEPATWAMMAGGFALMGVALRAARRGRAREDVANV